MARDSTRHGATPRLLWLDPSDLLLGREPPSQPQDPGQGLWALRGAASDPAELPGHVCPDPFPGESEQRVAALSAQHHFLPQPCQVPFVRTPPEQSRRAGPRDVGNTGSGWMPQVPTPKAQEDTSFLHQLAGKPNQIALVKSDLIQTYL